MQSLQFSEISDFYARQMWQKTQGLYPSAPLRKRKDDLEQRSKRKWNDWNTFINSLNNIKEMITYFKGKNYKTKGNIKILKH